MNNKKRVYVYQNYESKCHSITFSPKRIDSKDVGFLGRMDDPFFRINEVISPFPKSRRKFIPKKNFNKKFIKR